MFRRFIPLFVICLLALLCGGSSAQSVPDRLERFARWAGADHDLDFQIMYVDSDDGVNGYFMPPGNYCNWAFCVSIEKPTIRVAVSKTMPPDVQEFLIAHELAHYGQWKHGSLDSVTTANIKEYENNADLIGQQTLCQIGQPHAGRDTFAWLQAALGYTGDENHGTLDERIAITEHACDARYEGA